MKPSPNFKIPNGPDGKPLSFPMMMTLKYNSQELIDLVAEAGIPCLMQKMVFLYMIFSLLKFLLIS
ncbi:MAG: hypothetical protein ACKO52_04985 [Sediminibacterium sp.]